jgi:hypothetical protein
VAVVMQTTMLVMDGWLGPLPGGRREQRRPSIPTWAPSTPLIAK